MIPVIPHIPEPRIQKILLAIGKKEIRSHPVSPRRKKRHPAKVRLSDPSLQIRSRPVQNLSAAHSHRISVVAELRSHTDDGQMLRISQPYSVLLHTVSPYWLLATPLRDFLAPPLKNRLDL